MEKIRLVLGIILIALVIMTNLNCQSADNKQTSLTALTVGKQTDKIEELISKLGDDDFNTRESAMAELGKMGESVLERLQKSLKETKDLEIRRRVAELIKNIERSKRSKNLPPEYEKVIYASLRNIKTALEVYYVQYNKFPDNLDELLDGKFRMIDSIPDDLCNQGYKVQYHLNTEGKPTYVVWSVGRDGKSQITNAGNDQLNLDTGDDIFVTNAKDRIYQPSR